VREATVDFLDEQTSLRNVPKEIEVPVPGTERERWMYATGYIAGHQTALNRARTAIKSAVEMDKRRRR